MNLGGKVSFNLNVAMYTARLKEVILSGDDLAGGHWNRAHLFIRLHLLHHSS